MANTKNTKTTKTTKKVEKKTTTPKKEQEKKKTNNIAIILSVIGIALLVIVGAFIINKDKQSKEKEKYKTSYLLSNNIVNSKINDLGALNQTLSTAPSEYFVLVTYNDNKETYTLETGLKEIIEKYKFKDKFYYLDVKDVMKNDDYITRINSAFKTDKIEKVPVILYYKDNKLVDVVKRLDNHAINAGDFQKLIDIYLDL